METAVNTEGMVRKYNADLWPNDKVVIKGEECMITGFKGAKVEYERKDGSREWINPKNVTIKGEV